MESSNNNTDCGCGSDCCQPKKKNKLWKKIFFAIVILSAAAIVTLKIVGTNNAQEKPSCDSINNKTSGCCDTAGTIPFVKINNPQKDKSCCPKGKK